MRFSKALWFTSGNGLVGIVKANDDYEGVKYYISVVDGVDEELDINYIMFWGSRFPKNAGDALFGE